MGVDLNKTEIKLIYDFVSSRSKVESNQNICSYDEFISYFPFPSIWIEEWMSQRTAFCLLDYIICFSNHFKKKSPEESLQNVAKSFFSSINKRLYDFDSNLEFKIEKLNQLHGYCSPCYFTDKGFNNPITFKVVISEIPSNINNPETYYFKLPAHELRHAVQIILGLPSANKENFLKLGEDSLPQEIDSRFFQETAFHIYKMGEGNIDAWGKLGNLLWELDVYASYPIEAEVEKSICDLLATLISYQQNAETDSLIKYYLYVICWSIESTLIIRKFNEELFVIANNLEKFANNSKCYEEINKRIQKIKEQISSNVSDDELQSKLYETLGYFLKLKVELLFINKTDLQNKEDEFSKALIESILAFKNSYFLHPDPRIAKYLSSQICYLAKTSGNDDLFRLADRLFCNHYYEQYINRFGSTNSVKLKECLDENKWNEYIKKRQDFLTLVKEASNREDVLEIVNKLIIQQSPAKDILIGGMLSLWYEQGKANSFYPKYAVTKISTLAYWAFDFATLYGLNKDETEFGHFTSDTPSLELLESINEALQSVNIQIVESAEFQEKDKWIDKKSKIGVSNLGQLIVILWTRYNKILTMLFISLFTVSLIVIAGICFAIYNSEKSKIPLEDNSRIQTVINYGLNETAFVSTSNNKGLNLLNEKNTNGNSLLFIPEGSEVKIIAYEIEYSMVNGKKGRWCKVYYNGVEGWAWGWNLSKKMP